MAEKFMVNVDYVYVNILVPWSICLDVPGSGWINGDRINGLFHL